MKGLFAIAAFASVVTSSHAWTVLTETFERNTVLPNPRSFVPFYAGDTLSVDNTWTVVGNPPELRRSGVDLVRDLWPGTPDSPAGHQWLDLAGSPGPGGIRITLNLLQGYRYLLTWQDFTIQNHYLLNGSPLHYQVTVGSQAENVLAQTENVLVGSRGAWHNRSWSFVATAGQNTLTFFTHQQDNGNTGIDNIRLEATHFPSGEPIPEPFTMALGGAALAMAVARRRRARR